MVKQKDEAGNRQKNDELYPRVLKGERAAMDAMILLNMAMVKHTVQTFLQRNPSYTYLQADLISQGTIGLVQAVNKMAGIQDPEDRISLKQDKPNPTSLIGTYIFHRLGELIDAENSIRVPGRTLRRKKMSVPVKEESIDSSYTFAQEGLTDPRALVDLEDEIFGCCHDDSEREIIQHRINGRSDAEIADILGIPRSTVQLIRQQIYDRFRERNEEYD